MDAFGLSRACPGRRLKAVYLDFLGLSPTDRNLYLQEAATRRGLHPIIMEKDFWVCWLLGVLFGHEKFKLGQFISELSHHLLIIPINDLRVFFVNLAEQFNNVIKS